MCTYVNILFGYIYYSIRPGIWGSRVWLCHTVAHNFAAYPMVLLAFLPSAASIIKTQWRSPHVTESGV